MQFSKYKKSIFTNPFIRSLSIILFSTAVVSGVVYAAASSLAPTAPPAPTSYSLNDIYNKIMYGTETTPGSSSLAPGGAMRSIAEVYEAVGLAEATAGDLPLGQPLVTGQTASYATDDDGARQGGLEHSYTDNGDGTITDNNTGLMWKKCMQGQYSNDCLGSALGMTWQNAVSQCSALTLVGYSDWYLPSLKEILTLTYFGLGPQGLFGQTINTTYFPNTPTSDIWSGTEDAYSSVNAWRINFFPSRVSFSRYGKGGLGDGFHARCVRKNS